MAATSSVYHTMEPGQLFCTLTYKEGLIDKDETASSGDQRLDLAFSSATSSRIAGVAPVG